MSIFVKEVEVEDTFNDFKYDVSGLIEAINKKIGVLNIPESKDFVFKFGSRKYEDVESYNDLLLQEIFDADFDEDMTVVEYVVKDSCGTDRGCQDLSFTLGYDIL